MALVIFFVPDPMKGLAEMVRVVRPGGIVAAYAWDMPGGGFPAEPLLTELRVIGANPLSPPSAAVSRMNALAELWTEAGLDAVEIREIRMHRTFADFDEYWNIWKEGSPSLKFVDSMATEDVELVKERARERLPPDGAGRITYEARANAITGRVPQEW